MLRLQQTAQGVMPERVPIAAEEFHLHVDESPDGKSSQEVLDGIRAEIGTTGAQHVAIGRESIYELCHDTFPFTFNSLSWLSDLAVMAALDDVVFVSASKALIKLKASASQDQLLDALVAFDSRRPGLVRQLCDNRAVQVFAALSHCGSHSKKGKHRARKNHTAAPRTSDGLSPNRASGTHKLM